MILFSIPAFCVDFFEVFVLSSLVHDLVSQVRLMNDNLYQHFLGVISIFISFERMAQPLRIPY